MNKAKSDKGDKSTESSGALPKCIGIYSAEHTDGIGISGIYYLKYDIYFEAKKDFQLSEITMEYRPYAYIWHDNTYSAMGYAFDLPPQAVNDDAREKEYFNLIKPFATNDKPEAWGDRMDYVNIAKDWKVMYDKNNATAISHRTALVVAISHGSKNNECRFIYCSINQKWDGTKYGPSFMAGFNGSLGPISCKKAAEFKH